MRGKNEMFYCYEHEQWKVKNAGAGWVCIICVINEFLTEQEKLEEREEK